MKTDKLMYTEATTAAQPIDQPTLQSITETFKMMKQQISVKNSFHPSLQEINRLFRADKIELKDEFFR